VTTESHQPAADTAGIDYFSKGHPLRGIASKVALRARLRMYDVFREVMPVDPALAVIDIGVTPDRDLSDSNFFEQQYPYKGQVTATSVEDASFLEAEHPGLTFVQTDGDSLPFADRTFDVAFSSAVLEHVGDRSRQRKFVGEMTRVAKRFFLTTPNRNFPIELHTFLPFVHWLPQRTHQAVLRKLGMSFWASTDNLNLCRPADLSALFPAGTELRIRKQRLLGVPSNLIAYGRSPD